jgi:inosine-uridine nucleoside N-ribohydrolase
MKRLLVYLFLSVLAWGQVLAHSGKPRYHVVIDTDGAIDDMRALTMLLSGNDIRVLAITCSEGTLLPAEVAMKVQSLLSAFHHEGIPVGTSRELHIPVPAWRSFAREIQWAGAAGSSDLIPVGSSLEVISRTVEGYPDKITLIALGSLRTYADWIRDDPARSEKIERIIWYNETDIETGYNYSVDPGSYDYILHSGIPLEMVSNPGDTYAITPEYFDLIQKEPSVYASRIAMVHSRPPVASRIDDAHLKLWDDLVPLYLTVPLLFTLEDEGGIRRATLARNLPLDFLYETIGMLLASASVTNNRVFIRFPVDPALYKPDYAGMLEETTAKYGLIEWKAVCMTNEIHGHTGIYSIIGAKMGIRAMDYFNVGINNLTITTFSGNTPPLSCFNDGIQISSGATIGQGLITIADSVSAIPSALFEYNHQVVRISLNPALAEQMHRDIRYGVDTFGLQTDRYWTYIEQLAIRYWADFDRNKIFVIERM